VSESSTILRSSAVMAAGTVVSRGSGFVRNALLVAAIGSTTAHADAFTVANTIPNMLYILLAGGVFNAVLVPQLVRAMKNDADAGAAYTNRIITLAAIFLGAVTLLLVVAAPWVMRVYLSGNWYDPGRAAELEAAVDFARWCLPQVFFYGMFVLVGQVLNARGSFGPMMWAPIANNVIAIGVLTAYLTVFGHADTGGYSSGEELLLGLGSTAGIAAQFLLLLPVLRRAGFVYAPRFDFRGTGLGHTFRLATWTVLFVIVNQVAYTVVTRLANGGAADGGSGGTGYTVYSNAFLVTQVPHSIITVSLATAMLPALSRRAAAADLGGLGRSLAETLRTCLAVVIPIAGLVAVVADPVAHVLFGYGASADEYHAYVPTLAIFAPGLVVFTVHYLVLRGFYSLERNRTVFWIQCGVAATNIVAAVLLVAAVDPRHTSPALAAAYGLAYLVGAVTSYAVLARLLGDLDSARLVRFLVRIVVISAAATAAAWGLQEAFAIWEGADPGLAVTVLHLAVVGLADLAVVLLGARLLRVSEVNSVVGQVTRRLGRR